VFAALAPVALVVMALVALYVPTSRDPEAPRLDIAGLVMSTVAIGTLVFTIIEAPEVGWVSGRSLAGFGIAVLVTAGFVAWERRVALPMLDVTLFRNLRFTAASGSVTVAFFALFGFIFMVTQYFQFLKGYSPLGTGLRLLPVAFSIAAASVVGTKLAVRIGNKVVVATGLASITVAFLWISTASVATSYVELAAQMIVLGLGMGLTTAPATEAIMGVVPKEKAGIGSAMNDATRELGGTLGVAVIGSVFASLYASRLSLPAGLPAEATQAAPESVGGAFIAAQRVADAGRRSDGSELPIAEGDLRRRYRLRLRNEAAGLFVPNFVCNFIWLMTGAGYWWPGWVLMGTSIGLISTLVRGFDPEKERAALAARRRKQATAEIEGRHVPADEPDS
jgi:hypothetical protein